MSSDHLINIFLNDAFSDLGSDTQGEKEDAKQGKVGAFLLLVLFY